MLRMMLVGLLIPLGVGVLATMEFRASMRTAAVAVQPVAETIVGVSDSHVAPAEADRIETVAASSDTPTQPAPVEEKPELVDAGVSPSEDVSVGSSEPPRVIIRHRHNPKSKKTAAAGSKKVFAAHRPQSKRNIAVINRTTVSERRKAVSNTEFCRLSAFGGLRKALNSADCEI
jgi:hypothetical protein